MQSRRFLGGLVSLLVTGSVLFAVNESVREDTNDSDVAEGSGDADVASEPPPPPASTDLAILFMRAGVDAPALCAAGVTAENVASLLSTAEATFRADTGRARTLDGAYAEARRQVDRLRRLVRSGQGSTEDVAALAQAKSALAVAEAARDTYFKTLRDQVLERAASQVSSQVRQIHANQSWKVPTKYQVLDLTERQWVDLRDALAVKRIHENYGEEFALEAQQLIAECDGHADVAAAGVCLDTNLAAVQTAWNAAVSD